MNKKILLILLVMLIIVGYSQDKQPAASKDLDIFNETTELIEGIPEESIIKVVYKEENIKKEYYLDILEKLNIGSFSINNIRNTNGNCLEFNNNVANGYIESMSYDNYNLVIVEVSIKSDTNMLSELKNKVLGAIGKDKKDVRCFENLKVKIFNDNLNEVNNKITGLLKSMQTVNIQTIQLENGLSSTADTNRYTSIINDGEKIDFNYAVCRYSSGNYVILGTPTIMIAY